MVADLRSAANAYQNLARLGEELGQKSGSKLVGAEDMGGFGNMVSEAVSHIADQAKAADATTQAMAVGKVDLVDVVTAVAEAQSTVETVVALRDQVISAYEKILSMPI